MTFPVNPAVGDIHVTASNSAFQFTTLGAWRNIDAGLSAPSPFFASTWSPSTIGFANAASSSVVISASGGTAPYTYAITSGSLPSGVSLNASTGALTGTVGAGTGTSWAFVITATDAASKQSMRAYSGVVA